MVFALRSYVKIYGPPVLEAIRALERVAVDMPEVCIMNTVIMRGIPRGLAADLGGQPTESSRDAVRGYFESSGASIPVERCNNIISRSGEMLGDYDFFFEWFREPSQTQINELMEKIDDALTPLGCHYTLTTGK